MKLNKNPLKSGMNKDAPKGLAVLAHKCCVALSLVFRFMTFEQLLPLFTKVSPASQNKSALSRI